MAIKIGLALGGGGARGLAHIGVLKILQREKIQIAHITGCSIGAIVGGLYSLYQDADKVEALAYEYLNNPLFKELDISAFGALEDETFHGNRIDRVITHLKIRLSFIRTLSHSSIFDTEIVDRIYQPFENILIENLPGSFSAIATDLISGEEIIINHGSLKQAIMASSAIPGFFPPVVRNSQLLIDGATSDTVPVHAVKAQGADKVIAVDVTKCIRKMGSLDNALLILYRADEIAHFHLTQERLKSADLIIQPSVRTYSWAHFNRIEKIIHEGEAAAEKMLPEIEKLIR